MATAATDEAIYLVNDAGMASAGVELVGTLAVCSTLLLYLSELPLLKRLTVHRCTNGCMYPAMLIKLVANVLGLSYAVLSSAGASKLTHGIGMILRLIMCIAFIGASPPKSGAKSGAVVAAAFVGATKLYLDNLHSDVDRSDSLMLLSTVVCFIAFSTPGICVLAAWQNKNPALISIPITWGSLICSVCWCIYGFLKQNAYTIAPNIPGVVISLAALLVSNLLRRGKKEV